MDDSDWDRVAMEDLKAMAKETRMVSFIASEMTWWLMCCAVQLAARHPGFTGPTRAAAEKQARYIMDYLAVTPALQELAARGWNPEFDVKQERGAHDG